MFKGTVVVTGNNCIIIIHSLEEDEGLYVYLEIHGVQWLEGMKAGKGWWMERWVATESCQSVR